jgi:hypothetical protein
MKKLFLVIIVSISVNVSGQKTHKAAGDKPLSSKEYTDYQGGDSNYFASTVYTYNSNGKIEKEIITNHDFGYVDSIVRNYDPNNRIISTHSFRNNVLYDLKTWVYDIPKQRIDYYQKSTEYVVGNLDSVIHVIYKGVRNFDEVEETFSSLLAFMDTDIELRECDTILANFYDPTSSTWGLGATVLPKYQSGKPTSVKIEINLDYFLSLADMEDILDSLPITITSTVLTLTPNYNGDKITTINGSLQLTPIPIPITDFIVLTNQYNANLLTETKIEMNVDINIPFVITFQQYLGGTMRKYGYDGDNNVSSVIVESKMEGMPWTVDSKTYYYNYTKVGIKDINNVNMAVYQNIPNPARDIALITYNIPTDGNVIFTVYSTNGQSLFVQSEEAKAGENTLKMPVSNLATGMYFYSMEFDGQRITKKMSVQR